MLSPDVRALFKSPFKLWPGRRVCSADGHTAVTWFSGQHPRGWGRIQYMPDGQRLMNDWVTAYEKIVGAETDPEKVCELLNAAWAHGVEVQDAE